MSWWMVAALLAGIALAGYGLYAARRSAERRGPPDDTYPLF